MLGKKLELQWTNKDKSLFYDISTGQYEWVHKKDPRVSEPRILIEKKVYGDKSTENLLIKGDNLLALKALLQDFQNQVKLIYIDPPFNTGQAFEHYEDGLEHSIWLTMMRDRLELLYKLLRRDGTIWVHLDDNESHYCRMILDEIFGRNNYLAQIAYERSGSAGIGQGGRFLVNTHELILVYAKDITSFQNNEVLSQVPLEKKVMVRYKHVLQYEGEKEIVKELISKSNGEKISIYKHKNYRVNSISLRDFEEREQEILQEYLKNFNRVFRTTNPQKENSFQHELIANMDKGLYSVEYIPSRGKNEGKRTTTYYVNQEIFAWLKDSAVIIDGKIIKENKMTDFWAHVDIPKADLANEGSVDFRRGKKPEPLLKRILDLASSENDLILDSFAGSGTTGAVAHKMKRRWIMVELGEHAETHCINRLSQVVYGTDQSGISKAVSWKGGGGFKYFELGDSLFVRDSDLRLTVINPKMYNGALIRAVLKIEGFKLLHPDNALHGISGTTIAHVTEQYLSQEYIDVLLNEIGERSKLVIIYAKTISR
jgi:adenine-specific DNA-methyltransferase